MCYKVETRMDDIKSSSSPKSKMASSYQSRCMYCVMEKNLTRKFAANLSLKISFLFTISLANLATNFQDLDAKVKNLVALAPVLGTISRPVKSNCTICLHCITLYCWRTTILMLVIVFWYLKQDDFFYQLSRRCKLVNINSF